MSDQIELRGVTKVFGGGLFERDRNVALEGVSLTVATDRPAITAVAGESGSGKTTLARLLLGVIEPTSGQVLYNGKDLRKMSRDERRQFRREVQPIFQDPFEVYNPFYKIDHIFSVPVAKYQMASSKAEARKLVHGALEMVGLRPQETLGRYPHQLSGGQRQRAMVARALLLKPRVILADEPVSMVDASLRATILESVRRLNRELGISVVYITHDLTTAYQISDNIIVLYKGRIAEAGAVEHVIRDPRHPYTQLLVQSIPQPKPDKRWSAYELEAGTSGRAGSTGCKFADRCPSAMQSCWDTVPPLYQREPHRVASCFMYRDVPIMDGNDVATVFRQPARRGPDAAAAAPVSERA